MTSSYSSLLRIALILTTASALVARTEKAGGQSQAVALKVEYPLTTCVVSDEKLGGMGRPITYFYKQTGQPDRSVFFCCRGCIKDFEKAPATYLKKLAAAAGNGAAKK